MSHVIFKDKTINTSCSNKVNHVHNTKMISSSHQSAFSDFWLLPELVRRLRNYLSQSELATLCLVCWDIHHRANPILYERISMDISQNKDTKALSTLEALLAESPALANAVRCLHIRFQDLRFTESKHRTHHSSLSGTITKCPHLRELSILDYLLRPDPISSCVRRPHHGERSINEMALLSALRSPSLENVSLTLHESPETPLRTATLPISETITRLRLDDAYIEIETLRNIITAVPRLRHLDLCLVRYADPGLKMAKVDGHLDIREFWAAVKPVFATLESLHLEIDYWICTAIDLGTLGGGEGSQHGPFGLLPSLRSCHKLKLLEIAPEALLGWHGDKTVALSSVLPDSLETLSLRPDFDWWENSPWDFLPLSEKVEEYLKSLRHASLKHLSMTCYADEVKHIEDAVNSVTQVCNGLGAQFFLQIQATGPNASPPARPPWAA